MLGVNYHEKQILGLHLSDKKNSRQVMFWKG